MTREEAKHIVDVAFSVPQAVRRDGEDRTYHEDEIREAKNMAIQALSQEPTDAISREAVMNAICDYVAFEEYEDKSHTFTIRPLEKRIDELPSVTQKPETVTEFADRCRECGARYGKLLKQKSGKWIKHNTGHSRYYSCSKCSCLAPNTEVADGVIWKLSNYCPDCGARMVEPQESEDKE